MTTFLFEYFRYEWSLVPAVLTLAIIGIYADGVRQSWPNFSLLLLGTWIMASILFLITFQAASSIPGHHLSISVLVARIIRAGITLTFETGMIYFLSSKRIVPLGQTLLVMILALLFFPIFSVVGMHMAGFFGLL